MDLLKRDLAPISAKAWEEIDDTAREALRNALSARKFIDINGPHGIDYTSVSSGRLNVPKNQKSDGVLYGTYHVQPLTETRIPFSLPTWELDNIERGAKDADMKPVLKAARKIALFEEQAIYKGFKNGQITGISEIVKDKEIGASLESGSLIDTVSEAQSRLRREGIDPTADLAVSPMVWNFISRPTSGGTVRSIIEKQIGGTVYYSDMVDGALLVANRGGDLVLTIGQDFSIGYHSHTTEEVNLFLMESFTFEVVTPEAVVGIKV
jgi:uncharacterized linocin/CFP29 family protein